MNNIVTRLLALITIVGLLLLPGIAYSQTKTSDIEKKLVDQEQQIQELSNRINDSQPDGLPQEEVAPADYLSAQNAAASAGMVSFLFGAFCALWAQNTKRNAWAWFFLGMFFNVITVIVLLVKNSQDKAPKIQQASS